MPNDVQNHEQCQASLQPMVFISIELRVLQCFLIVKFYHQMLLCSCLSQ